MTTKTTAAPLEDRQRAAAEEAERLAQQIAARNTARQGAEDVARVEAARRFVDVDLPKLTEQLDAAVAGLDAVAFAEEMSMDLIWSAYLTVRTLSRTRHARHQVANGVLDSLDPLPVTSIGVQRQRPALADTWVETPWPVLVERILERRLVLATNTAVTEQHAVLDGAAAGAAKGYVN